MTNAVTATAAIPGTGNAPNSIYVYTQGTSWPTGIAAVPNLSELDAAAQSTINSQPQSTAFNATSLSDAPPPASIVQSPVISPTATNAVRSVNVSGVFGTVKNPA